MEDYLQDIAVQYRNKYLESRATPSSFAYTMTNTQNLMPILAKFYARLQRNRPYYLPIEKVQWMDALFQWFANYLDTTDPQKPTAYVEELTGIPRPLNTIQEAQHHLMNKFNEEFGGQDTMNSRHKRMLDNYAAMNGDDDDCYWSYQGPTGGAHIRPLVIDETMSNGIEMDFKVAQYQLDRKFTNNPTAMYGKMFRDQEAALNQQYGTQRSMYRTIDPAPYIYDSTIQ